MLTIFESTHIYIVNDALILILLIHSNERMRIHLLASARLMQNIYYVKQLCWITFQFIHIYLYCICTHFLVSMYFDLTKLGILSLWNLFSHAGGEFNAPLFSLLFMILFSQCWMCVQCKYMFWLNIPPSPIRFAVQRIWMWCCPIYQWIY